jgi:CubicO group peptidase (beta-lactamase class C family)
MALTAHKQLNGALVRHLRVKHRWWPVLNAFPSGRMVLQFVPALALACFASIALSQTEDYFPGPRDQWETREPEALGMDAAKLQQAIDYHIANEASGPFWGRQLENGIVFGLASGSEPFIDLLGPTRERGGPNGIVIRDGYIAAEWGPTRRVDMVFSMTKTFISTVAGLAWDRGMISDVHDKVGTYVQTGEFHSPHNAQISWDHLLRQTSEWQGTLWDRPAWADRPGPSPWDELDLEPAKPGTRHKYNDVRVNLTAYALLQVWRRPLPQVLREFVLDPIGASPTWQWHGYRNSWVVIDGLKIQSVSGGGHWGGGAWMASRDIGRFGYLLLRQGQWNGQQIISREWLDLATTPGELTPNYGFMNFRPNTDRHLLKHTGEDTFIFSGGGATNICFVDRANNLVVVLRWAAQGPEDDPYHHVDEILQRITEAIL